jgi:hypothetical protein
MPSDIILSVVMPSVVILSVVAPNFFSFQAHLKICSKLVRPWPHHRRLLGHDANDGLAGGNVVKPFSFVNDP